MTCSYLCVLLCLFTILKCVFTEYLQVEDNLEKKDTCPKVVFVEDTFSCAMIFMILFLIIFFLGLLKGVVGLICSRNVGMFGLNLLLDLPHPINHYYEPQLGNQPVVYDCAGWPIHPITKKRVRIINESSELCLNSVFFFVFPFFVMWVAVQNLCDCYDICDDTCSGYQGIDRVAPDAGADEYANEKTVLKISSSTSYCIEESQEANLSKSNKNRKCKLDTYKDENDTAEEKDTRYVLEQLTKSEDCLNKCLEDPKYAAKCTKVSCNKNR